MFQEQEGSQIEALRPAVYNAEGGAASQGHPEAPDGEEDKAVLDSALHHLLAGAGSRLLWTTHLSLSSH